MIYDIAFGDSGIYAIRNCANGKLYVGSSNNIRNRIRQHKQLLMQNEHFNKHLQSAWNKYGGFAFLFEVIELVENLDNLLEREQYWITKLDLCDRAKGYNKNTDIARPFIDRSKPSNPNRPTAYKGVCFDKSRNRWIANITINGVCAHLGSYESARDAAKIYDAIVRYYFPGGYVNFPRNKTKLSLEELAKIKKNRKKRSGCASIYRGVRKRKNVKDSEPWYATFKLNGVAAYGGDHKTEKDAAIAYDSLRLYYTGSKDGLNFPKIATPKSQEQLARELFEKRKATTAQSKYRGVCRKRKTWLVTLRVKGMKQIRIGGIPTELEAAQIHDRVAKYYIPGTTKLNFGDQEHPMSKEEILALRPNRRKSQNAVSA